MEISKYGNFQVRRSKRFLVEGFRMSGLRIQGVKYLGRGLRYGGDLIIS